jgi:DNA repair exonuclease SbcCD nuclease subunit
LADLKSKGYDYWALGHVHKREVVSEDPKVIFPGNIQGRHIKETGSKGATLITVEDGRITDLEARELDVLRWAIRQMDLSDCETTESVHEAVRSAFEQERDKADNKTLALRLILTGQCPVHAHLLDRTFQLTEEFRAIAESFGDLWLEKVQFKTTRKIRLEDLIGEDTPIAGLIESIQELEFDGEDLAELVPELATLKIKLPAELTRGDDPFLDPSPDKMAELRTEVQEMLISKLLQHGGER